MNVLILTPDRVGSTLLQRVLTIYMLRKEFDKPVINLHELTNGLVAYYNETMNREVLGKPKGTQWGYFQSLGEVEELLKSADHYKTSRLAHYHIVNRQDTVADQIKFYEYLNANFYIISCRRQNLFEYALSWQIQAHSKKLNVYNSDEKINVFYDIYKNGITATKETLTNYLTKYKKYIEWSDTYFNVQSYFNYDTDVHRIEDYILNLDFMKNSVNNTWQDMFGQKFAEYNACHRLLPNLAFRKNNSELTKQITYYGKPLSDHTWNQLQGSDWPATIGEFIDNKSQVPAAIQNEIGNLYRERTVSATKEEYNFLEKNLTQYASINSQLAKLVQDGFLVSPVPIKLQSFQEKKLIIKNFDECIVWYNEWVDTNKFGNKYDSANTENIILLEETKLNSPIHQQTLLQ